MLSSSHEKLLSDAKKAADKLHSDTSVAKGTTLHSLKDLHDHIYTLINAVENDMNMEGDDDDG